MPQASKLGWKLFADHLEETLVAYDGFYSLTDLRNSKLPAN